VRSCELQSGWRILTRLLLLSTENGVSEPKAATAPMSAKKDFGRDMVDWPTLGGTANPADVSLLNGFLVFYRRKGKSNVTSAEKVVFVKFAFYQKFHFTSVIALKHFAITV
jgi:hypothetical protein